MTNLEEYPVISALTPNEWAREAHIAPSRPIRFKGSSLCGGGGECASWPQGEGRREKRVRPYTFKHFQQFVSELLRFNGPPYRKRNLGVCGCRRHRFVGYWSARSWRCRHDWSDAEQRLQGRVCADTAGHLRRQRLLRRPASSRKPVPGTSRFVSSASPVLSRLIFSFTCQAVAVISPLSASVTPSLFHFRLKTYLCNKFFPS